MGFGETGLNRKLSDNISTYNILRDLRLSTFVYRRIIPAYGAMIVLTMYFIPYINTGPFWASKMWPEAEKCKNYWWANFLAVNNFMDVDNQVSSTAR